MKKYCEQSVGVYVGQGPEPVQVRFADVTLCLTADAARLLATHLGAAVLDLEPHHKGSYCSRCVRPVHDDPGPFWTCAECREGTCERS